MNTPLPESTRPVASAPNGLAGDANNCLEEKNGVVFYRGLQAFDQLEFPSETQTDTEDYEWAMQDSQIRLEHGGLVVAVRGRRVWGAGKNPRAAWEVASKVADCPPLDELLFIAIPGPMFGAGGKSV